MFTKGQKVVCADGDFPLAIKKVYRQLPRKGEVYTVRSTFVGRSLTGEPGEIGLLLEELVNPRDSRVVGDVKPELGFNSGRFYAA